MTTVISISELTQSRPFDEESEYITLDEVLDKALILKDVKEFENDKGPGVFALLAVDGETRHICTHSMGLVSKLSCDEVTTALAMGQDISCRIIQRKSTKSDRMVYDIV